MSTDLDLFKTINLIFTKEPMKPKTYNLRLNPNDSNNADKNIYDILINIFINGMNTLFGSKVHPGNITKEQFDLLNDYIKSLGYNTNLMKSEDMINISFDLLK